MAYRQSFEVAAHKIHSKYEYLELLQYFSANEMAVFNDCEYGQFTGIYSKVFGGHKRHPQRSLLNKILGSKKQSTKDKRAKTCIEKYGVSTPLLNSEVKDKIKKTNNIKYGVDHVWQSQAIIDKTNITKIKNGVSHNLGGQSARMIYDGYDIQYSYSKFLELVKLLGVDAALKWNRAKTDIEYVLENILNELGLNFVYDKKLSGTSYRPDFVIGNMIIETDGLKHHSDLYINKRDYHKLKQKIYFEHGYQSLFFRGDEILQSQNIVKSIIRAKLNFIQDKVYARSCSVGIGKLEFFSKNHLMGTGSGKIYSLIHNGEDVSCMQVICKQNVLEISRFCNRLDTIVVGGFSKLLKRAITDYQPQKVISFVDARYGNGHSLLNIGFKEISNYLSFKWTDFKHTFHRMKYRGNSGYDFGLRKIWDCGQKKFELKVV